MDMLLQDVRYAFRSLRKRVVFSVIAVLTLAAGIGASTAIFSVVNSALLRPLPFPDPDRLVKVSLVREAAGNMAGNDDQVWSHPKWEILRDEQRVYSELAAYTSSSQSLTGDGEPERVEGELVSAEYFSLLGIRPIIGRTFTEDEVRDPGHAQVALLGEALWSRRYNRDPSVLGRALQLSGEGGGAVTVVGVLPGHFNGLSGMAEIWRPLAVIGAEEMQARWSHFMNVVGRLSPAVTLERAVTETAALGRIIAERIPSFQPGQEWGATARSLDALRVDPNIRRSVLVLFGAVTALLLIACANVAGLLLARAADRRREIALRLALGARRARLIRQLVTEALVLSLLGGAAGILIGVLGVRLLTGLAGELTAALGYSGGMTRLTLAGIRIDGGVLLFTLAASLLTGFLFGIVPALQGTRTKPGVDLKEGGAGAIGVSLRGVNSRSVLVVAEVALAFVLLAGSALMVKSLANLLDTSAGIDTRNLLTMRIALPASYEPERRSEFWSELTDRLQALPGVEGAGVTACAPLSGGCNGTVLWYRDRPPVPEGSEPLVGVHWITANYLQTVRTPLLQGRGFEAHDRSGAPRVVLINQTAARTLFAGENPIGRRIGVGQGGFADGAEIIGVIGDQRFVGLETPPRADVYLPIAQSPRGTGIVFVRTTVQPTALLAAVRKEVQRLDANLPVYGVMTMEERVASSTARTRITGLLLSTFAATALILALVGIYGVIAFAVTQRTREFGLRIALGAVHRNIGVLVLRYGIAVVGLGTLIGIAGALASTRILRTMLFEVEPTDPLTFTVLALLTMLVALAATAAPAIRAMRTDPMVALKSD